MAPTCVHSCKGICSALEAAERREREALEQYRDYAARCDYPDVKEILEALIADREKGLRTLAEKREIMAVKLDVIDRISESFG